MKNLDTLETTLIESRADAEGIANGEISPKYNRIEGTNAIIDLFLSLLHPLRYSENRVIHLKSNFRK